MAEYIELKTLQAFPIRANRCDKEHANEHFINGIETVMEYAEGLPAADVAPVVHERWLKHYRSGVTVAEGCVSSCCDMWNERESRYCPNCGAKMDGGVNHASPD